MICSIATLPMLLAVAGAAVATEECVPVQEFELIETIGDGGAVSLNPLPETQEECAQNEPGHGGAGATQSLVAHFPPAPGARQHLAIDTSFLGERLGATQWLAQAIATAPDAPPQVIEIGLQRGAAGILLATRDATGRIAVAGSPLHVIGSDRALLSIGVTGSAVQTTLAIGGPGGEAVRWPLAKGASVTLLGAASTGPEPAVISLGNLD